MPQGQIFIISGPSGVGKNTIINHILQHVPGFTAIPTYTTRPPRPDDQTNQNRICISPVEFERMAAAGEFIEWKKNHAWLYGKKIADIKQVLDQGLNLILEIDVKGTADYTAKFPNVHTIFVQYADINQLASRLSTTHPNISKDEIKIRYQTALQEMTYAPRYDYVITNFVNHPEVAIKQIEEIILKNVKCKNQNTK